MNETGARVIRVALLDLYDGAVNQGMRCIRQLVYAYGEQTGLSMVLDEFDVRRESSLPGTEYDVYISSGGPGSPLESEGSDWEHRYFEWISTILHHNQSAAIKKHVLFICHSFQLACRYFDVASVNKRKSTAFGVFPVHALAEAENEPIFAQLGDPFYAVDSRDYQITQPNLHRIIEMGARILAIEKARPHVPYERAIMAIRFNECMLGTQFHPEADALGMLQYLHDDTRKKMVIEQHGSAKWESMVEQLNDPDKIMHTYATFIPNFITQAIETGHICNN